MSNKINRIIKHILYVAFAGILYGLVMYFVHSWLASYSLLYAYLGNLALILLALAADELTFKMFESVMQSEKQLAELKNSRFFRFFLDAFISFKAILYLFYISIMIFSQIIVSYPALVNESLGNFIHANEYSILLLMAIDLFSGQFSKDKERVKKLSVTFKEYLTKNKNP
jgi:hypothetical protein